MSTESFLVIAGEKSGVEHARTFLPKLIDKYNNTSFFGVGDEEFRNLGVETLFDIKDFSSMGFSEVILKLPFYFKARKKILNEVSKRNTKYALLIDFQTFNLSLVKDLKKRGVEKIFYFVAPQAWAWKEGRVKKIAKYVDHLFCILPFEKKWFRDRGVKQTHYVSHPVLKKSVPRSIASQKKVLVLPGSRNSEVKYHLPIFSKVLKKLKGFEFVLVKSPNVNEMYYQPYNELFHSIYDAKFLNQAIEESSLGLCSSGTVTLECALARIPSVVCYKVSVINEMIARKFLNYQGYVSLPNIILNEEVYPEMLQERCTDYLVLEKMKMIISKEKSIREKLSGIEAKFLENIEDTFEVISMSMSK